MEKRFRDYKILLQITEKLHLGGYQNSSLISGKVVSIHMTIMDPRYLDMASDIRYHH
jgi:hypothetical protein